jgi:hypothetical protein
VENEQDEFWIHYCSHDLVGLTPQERETMYYSEDEGLREAMEFLFQKDGRSDVSRAGTPPNTIDTIEMDVLQDFR